MKNGFPPERITTHTGYKKGTLIFRIAYALIRKVARELQKPLQLSMEENEEQLLELPSNWKTSYYLTKRKKECDDILSLRTQIYLFIENHNLKDIMSPEMQNEIDLIGDVLMTENKIKLDQ